jgi:hypothetical protein
MHKSTSKPRKRPYPLLKDRHLETPEERERRLRHAQIKHESRTRIRARTRAEKGLPPRDTWADAARKIASTRDRLVAEQENCCALCNESMTQVFLDHDHETGIIRACLCPRCNHGLGQLLDSPELLRRAADYIERFKGEFSNGLFVKNWQVILREGSSETEPETG